MWPAPPGSVRSVLLPTACLVLLSLSRSTGVTHWKLQDNAVIVPASTDLSDGQQTEDYSTIISNLQMRDPEFAVLLRHTKGAKAGGIKPATVPRQRGACPVVVDLDSQPSTKTQTGSSGKKQCSSAERQRVSAPRNPDGSGIM